MDRHDVAVAHGGERGEAEVGEVARQGDPRGDGQAVEGSGRDRADQRIERHENQADREIEQDGAGYAMVGDAAGLEHRASHGPDDDSAISSQAVACRETSRAPWSPRMRT